MEQMARFGFLIGMNVANSPQLPSWRPVESFSQRGEFEVTNRSGTGILACLLHA
jgi:hypothetical protein